MRRFFAPLTSLLFAAGACFGEAPLIGDDAGASTDTGDSTSAPSSTTSTDTNSTTSTTGHDESGSDSGTDAGAEVGSVGEVDTTGDPPIDCGTLEGHRVFVTEDAVDVAIGGWSLDAFDAHCTAEAEKYALVHPGLTFRAIMSDDSTSARQRLAIDCGPLYKQEGAEPVQVAEPGLLWEKGLDLPIDTTAGGDTVTQNLNVWTGTEPSGHASGATCANWTGSPRAQGTVGRLSGTGWDPVASWISLINVGCDSDTLSVSARVYCIEQPL